jgi:hypothetical protein
VFGQLLALLFAFACLQVTVNLFDSPFVASLVGLAQRALDPRLLGSPRRSLKVVHFLPRFSELTIEAFDRLFVATLVCGMQSTLKFFKLPTQIALDFSALAFFPAPLAFLAAIPVSGLALSSFALALGCFAHALRFALALAFAAIGIWLLIVIVRAGVGEGRKAEACGQ